MEDAEQLVLESAAASGNVAVLRYFLKRKPTLDVISQSLRYAIQGGVEIWGVLLEHNHDLIGWQFGHRGDLIEKVTR